MTPEDIKKLPVDALVPRFIDRAKHRHILEVWNKHMEKFSTLEETWPALVEAFERDGEVT